LYVPTTWNSSLKSKKIEVVMDPDPHPKSKLVPVAVTLNTAPPEDQVRFEHFAVNCDSSFGNTTKSLSRQ
jgi:hypothetical protein